MPRTFKLWLPVVLWMAIIFIVSTDFGSATHTSQIIEPLLRWFNPNISPGAIDLVQTLVRKGGHFTEYAILALLAFRATYGSPQNLRAGNYYRAAGIALLIAAGYAASDEFHQSFVPSRTASIFDVLIDTCGAFTALAIAVLWRKFVRNPTSARAAQTTP